MADSLLPSQHDTTPSGAYPMDTDVTEREPMTRLQQIRDEIRSTRNLDVGFEKTDFDIGNTIDMVMMLDKYTKTSIFNSWRFFLNMQCIRQAQRILPQEIDKTIDGRSEYDALIAHTMDEYEKAGDYATKLPAFIALNEHLRVTMYDDMLSTTEMSDTLEFMTRNVPTAASFEKDYDERVRQGMRPGISKRVFCELQLEDALKQHRDLVENGQAAIQFCQDLQVNELRGFGDLPDWAVDALYTKCVDKLEARWQKLDVRRTGLRTPPEGRIEAQGDQRLLEEVYKQLTGREFTTEY